MVSCSTFARLCFKFEPSLVLAFPSPQLGTGLVVESWTLRSAKLIQSSTQISAFSDRSAAEAFRPFIRSCIPSHAYLNLWLQRLCGSGQRGKLQGRAILLLYDKILLIFATFLDQPLANHIPTGRMDKQRRIHTMALAAPIGAAGRPNWGGAY